MEHSENFLLYTMGITVKVADKDSIHCINLTDYFLTLCKE